MRNSVCGERYKTTVLCIDSYEDGIPEGRFYNPYDKDGTKFRGLTTFLRQMEELLDTMNYPQSFSALRSFGQVPEPTASPPSDTEIQEGREATFLVRILFRQNASWQGSLTWLEGDRSQSFRSVLELILLMDSALRKETSEPDRENSA